MVQSQWSAAEILHRLVGTPPEKEKPSGGVESWLHWPLSVFMPVTGPCSYSISPSHSHPAYSFIYSFEGGGEVIVEGRPKENQLTGPNLCCFSPDIPHQEVIKEGFNHYLAVFVERNYFESLVDRWNYSPQTWKGDFFPASDQLLQAIHEFMEEWGKSGRDRQDQLEDLSRRISSLILRDLNGINKESMGWSSKRDIQQAQRFIARYFSEKLTLDQLAASANRSVTHFSRLFKEETGQTPMEYLQEYRINQAKAMLRRSELDISSIAYDCGFSSLSYFSSIFKRTQAITPKEYRRSSGKGKISET